MILSKVTLVQNVIRSKQHEQNIKSSRGVSLKPLQIKCFDDLSADHIRVSVTANIFQVFNWMLCVVSVVTVPLDSLAVKLSSTYINRNTRYTR